MKYVSIYSNSHLVTIRRNAMKKLVLILTLLLAALFLSAQAAPESTDDTVMIGISQLMAHPALDNIEQDLESLSHKARGTHIGELDDSWLKDSLPPQFLPLYDYDFLYYFR